MRLTICPLSICLTILLKTTIKAHQVHDIQSSEGWIPISRDRTSRYLRTNTFIPSQDSNNYFVEASKERSSIGDEDGRKNINIQDFNSLTLEKYKIQDGVKGKENVNNSQVLSINNKKELSRSLLITKKAYGFSDTMKIVKTSNKDDHTLQSSVTAFTSVTHPSTSFQPELGYDVPFISYSRHATNKSDATAYYPRPNDYYGTRDRHLRVNSDLNENIDPTPSPDSDEFKSNNLNSGSRIFKKTAEISKGAAATNFEPPDSHFDVNVNDEAIERSRADENIAANNQIGTKTDNFNANTYIYDHASIYHKPDNINTTNKAKSIVTNNRFAAANNFNVDPNAQYSEVNVLHEKRKVKDLTEIFGKILERYNLKQDDYLSNYDKSRYALRNNFGNSRHFYGPLMGHNSFGYNSLNHLSVDPVLAVILSRYGHYIPGYNGRNINYRNLYGYLASNNIHNNKPFGSYKIFSDSDV